MQRTLRLLGALVLCAGLSTAHAQSGHFVQEVLCADQGTTLQCCGKVAGLGGTTFEIMVLSEDATAQIACRNPGGNIAPGQDTSVTVVGTSGPLATPRNGHYKFCVTTAAPVVQGADACPNPQWTALVTDVLFTEATVTVAEDGEVSDTTPGTIVP